MGTLYLVATPIGNLEDISARALRILGQVRLIAAEDTRRTRQLLTHFQINTPLLSYYEHNETRRVAQLLQELEQGDVALVSDGGTPGINDPGSEIVQAAIAQGFAISPVPGPSAPISALIVSGLPAYQFLYLGYLPRKAQERLAYINGIRTLPYTLIFLETPHRLLASLQDLFAILGDRPISIARELTKLHEEILRTSLSTAIEHYQHQPPRGEFTLTIAGAHERRENWTEEKLKTGIIHFLEQATPLSEIADRLSPISGWKRKDIYQVASRLKKNTSPS